MAKTHAVLVFAALAMCLPAQSAAVSYFGKTCCKSGIAVTGLPKLGGNIAIKYTGDNYYMSIHSTVHVAQPWLILGASDKGWSGRPLPWTLPPGIAWTGRSLPCQLFVSFDVHYPMPKASILAYENSKSFTVPNDKNLLGLDVFAQWATYYYYRNTPFPAQSSWGTSNAAKLTIGT
ncbi:MAG: hypothetical protein ACYTGW_01835 [Planctomycetota bacterium]|jgi:hypothetical protein